MARIKFKKEFEELIYKVEIEAFITETSNVAIYQRIANRIREVEPTKILLAKEIERKLVDKLSNNDNMLNVYRNYLPPETTTMLKEVISNNGKVGEAFKDYLPIKIIADDLNNSIKNKLKTPLIITVLITFFMNGLLNGFDEMIHDPTLEVNSRAIFVAENYLYIVFPILLVIGLIVFKKPSWIFGVKKVLKKIESLMVCTTTLSLSKNSLPSSAIITFLRQTYKMNKVPLKGSKIKDLSMLLYRYKHITLLEDSALANVTFTEFQLIPLLEEIVSNRKKEALMLGEVIGDFISNISTILLVIPFTIAIYPIATAMMKLMSIINI